MNREKSLECHIYHFITRILFNSVDTFTSDAECDFKSWQKTLYICSSVGFLGAAFYLVSAFFVIKDWDTAKENEKGIVLYLPY